MGPLVIVRTAFFIVYFVGGVLSVRFSQVLAWAMCRHWPKWYHAWINTTKAHFLPLITFVSALVSPCKLVVTYDALSLPEDTSFRVDADGHLVSSLAPRAVFISNHQIYTDWMFFWFLSYTSGLASSVYIVMKESLGKVPVLGSGMVAYKFLFLLRKWETDKVNLTNKLLEIDADARGLGPASGVRCVSSTNSSTPEIKTWPAGTADEKERWPYHLFLFPEGTVISAHTRERSNKYIAGMEGEPLKHVLLPRVRGLFLILRLLRASVDVVYDVTVGYAGLTPEDYGEDLYTLKGTYLMGRGPPAVSMYISSFSIKDIPLGDDDSLDIDKLDPAVMKAFEQWLFKVWLDKDALMAKFFRTGSFADPDDVKTKTVIADFKLRHWVDAVVPFLTALSVVLLLRALVKVLVQVWRT